MTTTGFLPDADQWRARAIDTAVFPVRFPVPTTATEGVVRQPGQIGRFEPEPSTGVGDAGGERHPNQGEAGPVIEHGFVAHVEDDIGQVARDQVIGAPHSGRRSGPGWASSGGPAVFSDPPRNNAGHRHQTSPLQLGQAVEHHRWMVLSVDEDQGPSGRHPATTTWLSPVMLVTSATTRSSTCWIAPSRSVASTSENPCGPAKSSRWAWILRISLRFRR